MKKKKEDCGQILKKDGLTTGWLHNREVSNVSDIGQQSAIPSAHISVSLAMQHSNIAYLQIPSAGVVAMQQSRIGVVHAYLHREEPQNIPIH